MRKSGKVAGRSEFHLACKAICLSKTGVKDTPNHKSNQRRLADSFLRPIFEAADRQRLADERFSIGIAEKIDSNLASFDEPKK